MEYHSLKQGGDMALIKCGACGNDISENASACPGCGEKPPKKTSRITWAVLAFVLIAIGMRAFSPDEAPDTRTPEQKAAEYKKYLKDAMGPIIAARRMLKNSSKDANSLEFRAEFNSTYGDGGEIVCGEVNGKNSFGGYTGFLRFIASGQTTMMESPDEKNFSPAWEKFCIR